MSETIFDINMLELTDIENDNIDLIDLKTDKKSKDIDINDFELIEPLIESINNKVLTGTGVNLSIIGNKVVNMTTGSVIFEKI